jgi:hypothetical protein
MYPGERGTQIRDPNKKGEAAYLSGSHLNDAAQLEYKSVLAVIGQADNKTASFVHTELRCGCSSN